MANDPSEVTIRYIRSNAFRVYHANGVYGGMTPNGEIEMRFYVDRHSTPSAVTYAVDDGVLGAEVRREGQEAEFERELQAEVRLSLDTAKHVRAWLNQKIAALEDAMREVTPDGR